ncbi:MAG: TlyA family RNA methyltransferase [Verrucomicrobia bacterium]|nr:TlyA family RNA methyltransferase [Verrucomicrobiota bacterium]
MEAGFKRWLSFSRNRGRLGGVNIRLDQALVARGLCESREKAKRAVMAGLVRVNGQVARKASDTVREADALALDATEKFVSRGGHKLEHALEHFALDVRGLTAADLGASTGGFTDCLLQRGAARVFAVDVGQGQLAWKLRSDSRVVVLEKTNARELKSSQLSAVSGQQAAANVLLVVVDCSFISLRKILPAAVRLLATGGRIVALVKPQFEAGKAEADKGEGVITDPVVHARVLAEVEAFVLAELPGIAWRGVTESPLLGPAGNKEFLVLLERV